tara:strand:- start:41535 stop:41927 length:393 start_codon:yes stop_codon:yes gene_type:complete
MTHQLQASEILKVDESLGLVFGFAIICKVDGEDHFDLQADHIPEGVMLKGSLDFAKGKRVAKEMHQGDSVGDVVFMFPMTSEIAASLNIVTKHTGLLIAMQPDDPEVLRKFATGEYTGFSIGGTAVNETI